MSLVEAAYLPSVCDSVDKESSRLFLVFFSFSDRTEGFRSPFFSPHVLSGGFCGSVLSHDILCSGSLSETEREHPRSHLRCIFERFIIYFITKS